MTKLTDFTHAPDGFDVVAHTGLSNRQRATQAAKGLAAYLAAGGMTNDSTDTSITDLLADLMHLCDGHGLDINQLLERAAQHHKNERRDARRVDG